MPLAHWLRHIWRRWRKRKIEGCSIIVTNPDGEILLLRHSYGPKVWSLPGGGIERGEDPVKAAIREIYEEIGCRLDTVTPLGILDEEISGSPHTAHVFTAVFEGQPVADRREILQARFFPADRLPQPLGRLTNARIDLWRGADRA